MEALHEAADGGHNPVGGFIFRHAGFHRHHPMGAGLIHAGDNIPALVPGKSGLHFVPVVIGVLHADDGPGFAKTPQKALHLFLLPVKLAGIVHVLELAAAALPVQGAGGVGGRFLAGWIHKRVSLL